MKVINYKLKAAFLFEEIKAILLRDGCYQDPVHCSIFRRSGVSTTCHVDVWCSGSHYNTPRGVKVCLEKEVPGRYGFHGQKTLVKKGDALVDARAIADHVLKVLDYKAKIAIEREAAKTNAREMERLAANELGEDRKRFRKCERRPDGTYDIVLSEHLTLDRVLAIIEVLS